MLFYLWFQHFKELWGWLARSEFVVDLNFETNLVARCEFVHLFFSQNNNLLTRNETGS